MVHPQTHTLSCLQIQHLWQICSRLPTALMSWAMSALSKHTHPGLQLLSHMCQHCQERSDWRKALATLLCRQCFDLHKATVSLKEASSLACRRGGGRWVGLVTFSSPRWPCVGHRRHTPVIGSRRPESPPAVQWPAVLPAPQPEAQGTRSMTGSLAASRGGPMKDVGWMLKVLSSQKHKVHGCIELHWLGDGST